jgi:cell division protein FtsB
MLPRILKIVKNKYFILTAGFFFWLFIFDRNNLIAQIELAQKLHQLNEDKAFYMEEIEKNRVETHELLTNPDNLEKFARERYLMKRDSEDIFLIVRTNDSLPK